MSNQGNNSSVSFLLIIILIATGAFGIELVNTKTDMAIKDEVIAGLKDELTVFTQRINGLVDENKRLLSELEKTLADLATMRQQLEATEADDQSSRQKIEDQAGVIADLEGRLASATADQQQTATERDAAVVRAGTLEVNNQALMNTVAEKDALVAGLIEENERLSTELGAAQANYDTQSQKLKDLNAAYADLSGGYAEVKDEYDILVKEMAAPNCSLLQGGIGVIASECMSDVYNVTQVLGMMVVVVYVAIDRIKRDGVSRRSKAAASADFVEMRVPKAKINAVVKILRSK